MKRYEEYTTIDSRWANYIPASWTFSKIAEVFIERKETNDPIKTTDILSLTNTRGVIPYREKGNIGNKAKEDLTGYRLAYPEDIVFNSMNAVIGSVGLSKYFGAVSPVYYMLYLRDTAKNNIRFFDYVFQDRVFQSGLNGLGNGILEIRMRIPMSKLKYVGVPVPHRTEQDQIVRYLDWQVSKINRLIAAKRKEIALLKEQKQRKITEVVVHGLKPNVPHKDTGIAWIGLIPAHWHCVALKRCATVKSGITLGKQYPAGTNLVSVPYLRVANVQDGFVNIETVANLNVTPEEAAQYRLPRGCVLMTEGGDRDKLGRGCVWNGEIENCIHQNHIFAVTVNDKLLLNKWLEYVSACDIGRVYFDVTAIKTTNLACTNASKVMAFPIPLPPRDEQECIINELNRITSRFNNAREGLEKQIEYLQELRIRLISDVVTGQIDVRGIEVPKHESVDDVVAESELEELEVE